MAKPDALGQFASSVGSSEEGTAQPRPASASTTSTRSLASPSLPEAKRRRQCPTSGAEGLFEALDPRVGQPQQQTQQQPQQEQQQQQTQPVGVGVSSKGVSAEKGKRQRKKGGEGEGEGERGSESQEEREEEDDHDEDDDQDGINLVDLSIPGQEEPEEQISSASSISSETEEGEDTSGIDFFDPFGFAAGSPSQGPPAASASGSSSSGTSASSTVPASASSVPNFPDSFPSFPPFAPFPAFGSPPPSFSSPTPATWPPGFPAGFPSGLPAGFLAGLGPNAFDPFAPPPFLASQASSSPSQGRSSAGQQQQQQQQQASRSAPSWQVASQSLGSRRQAPSHRHSLRRQSNPDFFPPFLSAMDFGGELQFSSLFKDLKCDGSPRQLNALTELSEYLSYSSEDTLISFPMETFIPAVVNALESAGRTGDDSAAQVMMLCCHCLCSVVDILPPAARLVTAAGGLTVLCNQLMNIEYIDVAEMAISLVAGIAEDQPLHVLKAGGLSSILTFLDFFQISVQRQAVHAASQMLLPIPTQEILDQHIKPVMPTLSALLRHSDDAVCQSACECWRRVLDNTVMIRLNPSLAQSTDLNLSMSAALGRLRGGGRFRPSSPPGSGLPHGAAEEFLFGGGREKSDADATGAAAAAAAVPLSIILEELCPSGVLQSLIELLTNNLAANSAHLRAEAAEVLYILALLTEASETFAEEVLKQDISLLLVQLLELSSGGGSKSNCPVSLRVLAVVASLLPAITLTESSCECEERRSTFFKERPEYLSALARAFLPRLMGLYRSSVDIYIQSLCITLLLTFVLACKAQQELLHETLPKGDLAHFLADLLNSRISSSQSLACLLVIRELIESDSDSFSLLFVRHGVVQAVHRLTKSEKRGTERAEHQRVLEAAHRVLSPYYASSAHAGGSPVLRELLRISRQLQSSPNTVIAAHREALGQLQELLMSDDGVTAFELTSSGLGGALQAFLSGGSSTEGHAAEDLRQQSRPRLQLFLEFFGGWDKLHCLVKVCIAAVQRVERKPLALFPTQANAPAAAGLPPHLRGARAGDSTSQAGHGPLSHMAGGGGGGRSMRGAPPHDPISSASSTLISVLKLLAKPVRVRMSTNESLQQQQQQQQQQPQLQHHHQQQPSLQSDHSGDMSSLSSLRAMLLQRAGSGSAGHDDHDDEGASNGHPNNSTRSSDFGGPFGAFGLGLRAGAFSGFSGPSSSRFGLGGDPGSSSFSGSPSTAASGPGSLSSASPAARIRNYFASKVSRKRGPEAPTGGPSAAASSASSSSEVPNIPASSGLLGRTGAASSLARGGDPKRPISMGGPQSLASRLAAAAAAATTGLPESSGVPCWDQPGEDPPFPSSFRDPREGGGGVPEAILLVEPFTSISALEDYVWEKHAQYGSSGSFSAGIVGKGRGRGRSGQLGQLVDRADVRKRQNSGVLAGATGDNSPASTAGRSTDRPSSPPAFVEPSSPHGQGSSGPAPASSRQDSTASATASDRPRSRESAKGSSDKARAQVKVFLNGQPLASKASIVQSLVKHAKRPAEASSSSSSTAAPAAVALASGQKDSRSSRFLAMANEAEDEGEGGLLAASVWGMVHSMGYQIEGDGEEAAAQEEAGGTPPSCSPVTSQRTNASQDVPYVATPFDALVERQVWVSQWKSDWKALINPESGEQYLVHEGGSEAASGQEAGTSLSCLLQLVASLHNLVEYIEKTEGPGALSSATLPSPREAFESQALTSALLRQLSDPLAVCTGSVPPWCLELAGACGYLFPRSLRRVMHQVCSLGPARAMQHVQQRALQQYAQTPALQKRLESEMAHISIPRQKVRISRQKLMESAVKVMNLYGSASSILEVEFLGEVGTGSGPTLEFFAQVGDLLRSSAPQLFRAEVVLGQLFPAPRDPTWLKAQNDQVAKTVLERFRLLGHVVAKCILDSRLVDIQLHPLFWRGLLHRAPFTFDSLRELDVTMYNSLRQLRSMDDEALQSLCITFTLPGNPEIELMPGGADVTLSKANLEDYINKVAEFSMVTAVAPQLEAFRTAFSELLPLSACDLWTEEELASMIVGSSVRDDACWTMEHLSSHIKAQHGYSAESRCFRDLLTLMANLTVEDRRRFLTFVTGATSLPVGGFGSLKPPLTVVRKEAPSAPLTPDHFMPSVMTCANYLKLPEYSSASILEEKLRLAMSEGQSAFLLS